MWLGGTSLARPRAARSSVITLLALTRILQKHPMLESLTPGDELIGTVTGSHRNKLFLAVPVVD